MKLTIYARRALADTCASETALLLEGSWPRTAARDSHWSLDDTFDARHAWIDEAAGYWAEYVGAIESADGVNPAGLNALGLRYFLAKSIRVISWFSDIVPPRRWDAITLIGQRGVDDDYAQIIEQICCMGGAEYEAQWIEGAMREAPADGVNAGWRRMLAAAARRMEPRMPRCGRARVILAGNPHLLGPVCGELGKRGAQMWWLDDRFAVKNWLRWRPAGCGQLTCDSSEGRENRLRAPELGRIDCRGVDLAGPIADWLTRRLAACGAVQTRMLSALDAHFSRVRPDALVLDQDATPLARAAVAIARRFRVPSIVVQHGAPCCRFGFAPLAADRMCVWGESSADQLACWGVPRERMELTGSPRHDPWMARLARPASRSRAGRRVLLLATIPPRDERPDAVTLGFNVRSYAELMRTVFETVARTPRTELVIKLHPRACGDPAVEAAMAEHPGLPVRIVREGPLEPLVAEADCVLSCPSSAGVEATLFGRPVIALLTPASGRVLPHYRWGMLGTARTARQLEGLLTRTLTQGAAAAPLPDASVFANLHDGGAAARIAESVLREIERAAPKILPLGDTSAPRTRESGGHAA